MLLLKIFISVYRTSVFYNIKYLKVFVFELRGASCRPIFYCSAFFFIVNQSRPGKFFASNFSPNSLLLTFRVIILYLSYMEQKPKLLTQSTGFPNFISGLQAVCCPAVTSSAVCLKINSSSQNCLHVSVSISFLPVIPAQYQNHLWCLGLFSK